MSEPKKYFVCGVCGNQVELFEDGGGDLVCCGEPMMIMDESCNSARNEEHEIKTEKIPGGIRVSIGKNQRHPMTPGHWIQWIECWVGNHSFRKHFRPDEKPTADFLIEEYCRGGEQPGFRMYCNIHGMRYCGNCEKCEPQPSCETHTCASQEKTIPV